MSDGEGYDEFRPQIVDRRTDSPLSSRYSSGESEFDRYCSANSVMGTPSLCSSVGAFHECGDSDFGGSTRSFGAMEGDFNLEGFTFSGKLEDEGVAIDSRVSTADLGFPLSNVSNLSKDETVTISTTADDDDMHSEGEDSMFNSGSDGEKSENRATVHFSRPNGNNNDLREENTMLMSSSVAFGSNDWEDFELERTENGSTSQIFDDSWQKTRINRGEFDNLSARLTDQDDVHDVGSSVNPVECLESTEREILWSARDVPALEKKNSTLDEEIEYLEGCDVYNIFEKQNSLNDISDKGSNFDVTEEASGRLDGNEIANPKDQLCDQEQTGSSSDMLLGLVPCPTNGAVKNGLIGEPAESSGERKLNSLSSGEEGDMARIGNELDRTTARLPPTKDKSFELNAFYDEFVHDMEEILMDSLDSPINRLRQSSVNLHSQHPSPLREHDSTTSSSVAFDGNPQNARIDGVEVVGAKQKKGDISLSERLVGVKEHTVYVIRVWSGATQWEVEHRYRDFYTLYRRLKSLFADQGWILPSSWSAVEWESRKIFGNSSPDVVSERSALIQDCLRSVLQFSYPSGLPNALLWFLSNQSAELENRPALGNTVSLVVDIRPHKSLKQILEEQHYVCPGCHKHLDGGKTRFQEFVQTLGLGKPRLCEYMGQLFCSSCHTNDTAVLPARVLHHWDFTQYPVSQLAKLYLDSIIDQPMLCVSAVNPTLMSKVKVLLHVVSTRAKIRALLEYVHCPFRGSIYRGLGSRKYLVESTDFFSLRNLIDLSRGAFAVLPTNLETILKKIEEHITEQCLVCCDRGVPCGARQFCHDVSSLIFPFQDEDEIEKCHACKLPFHKNCFAKLTECQCGARLNPDVARSTSNSSLVPGGSGSDGALSLFRMKSDLFSKLVSPERRENSSGEDNQKGNNFILMGSLPGNSL